MLVKCPNPECEVVYDDSVTNTCPRCKPSKKHAVAPRDLRRPNPRHCAHGELLYHTCLKCERTEKDADVYRNSFLSEIKDFLITYEGVSRKDAWAKSVLFLTALEAAAKKK